MISSLVFLSCIAVVLGFVEGSNFTPHKAVAVMKGPSNVTGTITFTTAADQSLTIVGNLTGLDPSAQRGLHVHEFGDATDGCASAGLHFNPFNQTHGAPTDPVHHLGDLGNIASDANGVSQFTILSRELSLEGPLTILGRTIVLHAGTDDLGKGGFNDSLTVGHSGARSACGIIGLSG